MVNFFFGSLAAWNYAALKSAFTGTGGKILKITVPEDDKADCNLVVLRCW
jgi:hypothetical protein